MQSSVGSVSWTRRLVVLFTICLAASVGVLVGGTSKAFALASYCSGEYQAGYVKSGVLPSVGQSVTAQIDLVESQIYSGYVKGYIEVILDATHYLRIGVRDEGLGAEIFIGYNGNTTHTFSAAKQNFYTVSISRDNSTSYTAHYNGNSFQYTESGGGSSVFTLDDDSTNNSICNQVDYYFRHIGPWNIDGMNGFTSPPYLKHTVSTTEFEAFGP